MSHRLSARVTAALAGRYRIERVLGQGGMAVVFLARQVDGDRLVALKVLNPEVGEHAGGERFLREIEVEQSLDHPGIIPVLEAGEQDGLSYYVMPFVEGETLRDRVERLGPLPVPEALRIIRAAGDALAHAHARGIIHRDVKPENILLGADDLVVLADFGIARAVSAAGGERLTQTGMIVGTPAYMAPELMTGLTAPTPAVDQYGLACVLFETLMGAEPFPAPTIVATMKRHALEPPPRLTIVRPDVPPTVEQAMHRALAKKPEGRFPDVATFVDALEGKVPVAAAAPASAPAGAPPAKKGCAGGALLLLAAATTAAVLMAAR